MIFQYNKSICLDIDALNLRLEEGVASIDAEKEEERRKAEMDHEEADEEGWVTVSRHTSRWITKLIASLFSSCNIFFYG